MFLYVYNICTKGTKLYFNCGSRKRIRITIFILKFDKNVTMPYFYAMTIYFKHIFFTM